MNEEQDNEPMANKFEEAVKSFRDNILKPMHDSINKCTNDQTQNILEKITLVTKDLTEIKESLKIQQEHDNSFIVAVKNLKWDD